MHGHQSISVALRTHYASRYFAEDCCFYASEDEGVCSEEAVRTVEGGEGKQTREEGGYAKAGAGCNSRKRASGRITRPKNKAQEAEQLKAALNVGAVHVSVQADQPVFH